MSRWKIQQNERLLETRNPKYPMVTFYSRSIPENHNCPPPTTTMEAPNNRSQTQFYKEKQNKPCHHHQQQQPLKHHHQQQNWTDTILSFNVTSRFQFRCRNQNRHSPDMEHQKTATTKRCKTRNWKFPWTFLHATLNQTKLITSYILPEKNVLHFRCLSPPESAMFGALTATRIAAGLLQIAKRQQDLQLLVLPSPMQLVGMRRYHRV